MTNIPPDAQEILDCLKQVAADTLERKRRLGHYAVIWRDGKPVAIGEDAPAHLTVPPSESLEKIIESSFIENCEMDKLNYYRNCIQTLLE
jgi:hypothetical protein